MIRSTYNLFSIYSSIAYKIFMIACKDTINDPNKTIIIVSFNIARSNYKIQSSSKNIKMKYNTIYIISDITKFLIFLYNRLTLYFLL